MCDPERHFACIKLLLTSCTFNSIDPPGPPWIASGGRRSERVSDQIAGEAAWPRCTVVSGRGPFGVGLVRGGVLISTALYSLQQ